MNVQVQKKCNKVNQNKMIIYMTVFTSIMLNHLNASLGMSVSIADIFIIFSTFLLILKNEYIIPIYHIMFFVSLSILLITTSIFYSPTKFNFDVDYSRVIINYIKLLVSLLYFLLGYNISRLKMMKVNIKWYSIGAMIIGIIGLLMNIININYLDSLIYYDNIRFRGLMMDPNYYSVIQCTALVYFLRNEDMTRIKKAAIYLLTLILVIMSGSKTGIITLIIYSIIFILENLYVSKKSYKSIIRFLTIFILIIISSGFLSLRINTITNKISELFPIFNRILNLFNNFSTALVEGGSSRNITWENAIGIIKYSPLIGVGVGTYSTVNKVLFDSSLVAHNTYLQIFSEWGVIMGTVFFGYIFIIINKSFNYLKKYRFDSELLITRDIIIILLIGSLAISLNNARMFWMFLGGLIYSYSSISQK